MTKKQFISLANHIRYSRKFSDESKACLAAWLADWLVTQNPRFMRERFIGFALGNCGPNGGAIKGK